MFHTQIVLDEWQRLDTIIDVEAGEPHQTVLTGHDLFVADVIAVSRYNASVGIEPSVLQSMQSSLNLLEERIRGGDVIYGVNTGFGGSADIRTKKFVQLQQALIRELHYGILSSGPRDHCSPALETYLAHHQHEDVGIESSHLPWTWTRAAILIRINSLISGCSSVRPIIVERMRDLLTHNIIPTIPLRGSISASGDLSPLSYVCGAIQGKSTIRVQSANGQCQYADQAFAKLSLEPIILQAKEGLAMTNGTTISAAAASLALHDIHIMAVMAQILTAMTVEALNGTTESFHPFFSQVRPHPGQIESARNIMGFLLGSKLTQVNEGRNSNLRQDRYSVRTAPQWLGPILEDLVLAHQQIVVECNSVTDNPLNTPDGEFLHGGNFQAKAVTSAMEKARQGAQGIGRMLFSQCTELINPATNRGLPPNLVAEDPGISLIFKGTDLHIAALTAELGFLASPVNHVQTAEMGNQSLNSLALISARYTHMANEVLAQLLAVHLVAVCQALDLRALQLQFIEQYKSQFYNLVSEHYPGSSSHDTVYSANGQGLTLAEMASSLGLEVDSSTQMTELALGSTKTVTSDTLPKLLWAQLLVALDSTTSLDAEDRFITVAKLLRPVLMDQDTLKRAPDFVTTLETFTDALAVSLGYAWCTHRDAYLLHGDATPALGFAARTVYRFVRTSLQVPLMATWNLSTPSAESLDAGTALHGTRAPTVGSYNGTVYRSIRDGTFAKVTADILRVVQR